jgi:mannan endo-1,6-alpha-mannosidase
MWYVTVLMLHVIKMTNSKQTQNPIWKTRIDGIIQTAGIFFANGVMKEVACEDNNKCDVDQRSFKAYLARWMAATTKLAPWTAQTIVPLLQSSAKAALSTCVGGPDGNQCGQKWTTGTFDGSLGVGEQMSVLEVVQSTLIGQVAGPVTANTGGSSQGDPSAGTSSNAKVINFETITTGDKAGAGILTTLIMVTMFGGSWWIATK